MTRWKECSDSCLHEQVQRVGPGPTGTYLLHVNIPHQTKQKSKPLLLIGCSPVGLLYQSRRPSYFSSRREGFPDRPIRTTEPTAHSCPRSGRLSFVINISRVILSQRSLQSERWHCLVRFSSSMSLIVSARVCVRGFFLLVRSAVILFPFLSAFTSVILI